MIDTHCHLSYKSFDPDRDEVIQKAQKTLKAVIDCGPNPTEAEKSLEMHKRYPNFVFSTLGLHPIYVKDFSEKEIEQFIEFIKANKENVHGIGECGLDYFHVRGSTDIQKTKDVFIQFIELAKELKKPIVVHSRDASEDTIKILEDFDRKVQWHMFTDRKILPRVLEKDWMISINTLILRSKDVRKIARDVPLERIMLETDAPWLGPGGKRNTPLSIRQVAEKVAQVKKLEFGQVWKACGANAVRFFGLPVKI